MRIHTDFSDFSEDLKTVVTIGTFDGVHLGHQSIIAKLKESAKAIGGQSVILTFYPHPRMVLYPEDHGLQLLNTPEEKAALLAEAGIDHLMIYPFSIDFSRISAYDYVRNLLVNGLKARKVIVGYDHRFGRNREGDFKTLQEWAEMLNFETEEIPAKDIDEVNISSTKIRTCLLDGEISTANTFLGYAYSLKGKVVHGAKKGRTIGFPTANLEVNYPYKLIPGNGVYAVRAKVADQNLTGVMNIGYRPTVENTTKLHLEVHLFNFNESIYDQEIEVFFIEKLRNEKKFGSIDELQEQIAVDILKAKTLL
ncbi:MAG: bifunctional riboflavin kinase/FAD synthetase [Flavobacteriales bacterium]